METNDAGETDMPDPGTLAGKQIDTATAFGGGAGLGRDAQSRVQDLSGAPDSTGAAEPSPEGPDENLQQILGGEVPK